MQEIQFDGWAFLESTIRSIVYHILYHKKHQVPTAFYYRNWWYRGITRATLTPKYPRLPRSIYVQHVETVKQSGPWNNLGIWAHAEDGDWNSQPHETVQVLMALWGFCGGYVFETWKFHLLSHIWPWRSTSITFQNNRDLNQGILHLWSKFGDPSLNGWWIMVWTNSRWGKFGHLWSNFGDPSLNGSRVIAWTSMWFTRKPTDRHIHT